MTTKVKLLHDTVGIPTGAVAVTQSASDNTTKVATTAYVTTALANLADSAPSTLNTLNELAAALGDDANFSTTVTNSIATKLPLAGGTMTGNLNIIGGASDMALIVRNSASGTSSSDGLSITVENPTPDVAIRQRENANMKFYTNNTERMRIDSAGKVGISTTASLSGSDYGMLTIKKTGSNIFGDSAITINSADTNQSTLALGLTSSVAYIDSTESGSGTVLPLVFATGSTERMRIDNAGLLSAAGGLKTTQTTALALDLNGTYSGGNYISFKKAGAAEFYIGSSNTVGAGSGYYDLYAVAGLGQRFFTGAAERMRITDTGDVSIGSGHAGFTGWRVLNIRGASANDGALINFENSAGTRSATFANQSIGMRYQTHISGGYHRFETEGTPNGYPLYIANDGKVGIGTGNPVNTLEIQGSSYDQIRIGSNHTDNTNKLAGIVSTTYTNQSVSVFQMFNQNGSNAIYYGSADGAHRGIQTHNFYVNTNYNSTSGHTRTLQIRADGDVHAAYTGSADTSGYFYAGKDWGAGNHRINRAVAQGSTILVISAYGSSGQDTALFYGCSGQDANSQSTGLRMQKNSSNNRSINAAGTINASGSDYAEYVKKSDTCGAIAKGDICGIDVNSKITDKWSEAHSFVVKSTDPSYVGGDSWGTLKRPELTKQGYADPDNPADETDAEYATRTTQHETDLAAFETASEAERVKYDRIAFSGQVPCNLTGASVGDYIIPKEGTSDAITGEAVSSPTFEQYQKAVGKVWKVLDNGKAWISVKIG